MADYGSGDATTGPGTWKYVSTIPTRLSSAPAYTHGDVTAGRALLTTYTYESDSGRLSVVSDPLQVKTKTFYDDLSRRTFVAENYNDFSPPTTLIGGGTNNEQDRVTKWEYNGLGTVAKLIAYNGSSGAGQTTTYLSENTHRADFVTNTIYPDSADSTSGGTDQIAMEFDLDGRVKKHKGQGSIETARTIHEYTYNGRRQLELDKATQLGTGIDNAIQSIKRTYDTLGRLEYVTSYSANNGAGTVQNEIKHTYHSTLGYLQKTEQSHQNAVTTGTPAVQYARDATTASATNIYDDGLRLESVTYPKTSRVIFSDYNSADTISDRLSRVYRIRETNSSGTILTQYSYNGVDRNVITDYQPPDVNLIVYFGVSGSYHGFDRFGRVIDHMWDGYNATFDVARVKYGYDSAGNRTWREDVIAGNNGYNHDEYYTYDGIHRLKNGQRGNLTGSPYSGITSKNFEQSWTLDQLGNWTEFKQDTDGNGSFAGSSDLDQDRLHNSVNEIDNNNTDSDAPSNTITAAAGQRNWLDPTYDKAGNTTQLPGAVSDAYDMSLLKYDAWNRPVRVDLGALNPYCTFEYDGLGRRIVQVNNGISQGTYDYYYNDDWQLLEERKGGDPDPLAQYVWHPYYIDALAVRYHDANTDNDYLDANEGAHFFSHDANYNVSAVVNASGTVLERYQYSPYGEVKVLDANFAVDADGTSDIGNTHLYTGREVDGDSRLQLSRNRYYAAHLGRWLSRDPIGYLGGDANLYGYVHGRPTGLTDPTGEAAAAIWGVAIGFGWFFSTGENAYAPNDADLANIPFLESVNTEQNLRATAELITLPVGGRAAAKAASYTSHVLYRTLIGGAAGGSAHRFSADMLSGEVPHYLEDPAGTAQNYATNVGAWTVGMGLGEGAVAVSRYARTLGPVRRVTIERGQSPSTVVQRTNAELVSDIAVRAERRIGGTGAVAGTAKHTYARDLLRRYQDIYGNRGLQTEVSVIERATVPYATPGSVRLDVIEGSIESPRFIYDYKFGTSGLTPARVKQIQRVGGFQSVPVIEVRP